MNARTSKFTSREAKRPTVSTLHLLTDICNCHCEAQLATRSRAELPAIWPNLRFRPPRGKPLHHYDYDYDCYCYLAYYYYYYYFHLYNASDYKISLCVCQRVSEFVTHNEIPSISRERLKLETSNLVNGLATGNPNEKMKN